MKSYDFYPGFYHLGPFPKSYQSLLDFATEFTGHSGGGENSINLPSVLINCVHSDNIYTINCSEVISSARLTYGPIKDTSFHTKF